MCRQKGCNFYSIYISPFARTWSFHFICSCRCFCVCFSWKNIIHGPLFFTTKNTMTSLWPKGWHHIVRWKPCYLPFMTGSFELNGLFFVYYIPPISSLPSPKKKTNNHSFSLIFLIWWSTIPEIKLIACTGQIALGTKRKQLFFQPFSCALCFEQAIYRKWLATRRLLPQGQVVFFKHSFIISYWQSCFQSKESF